MEDYLRSTNDWDLDAIIRGWEGVQVHPPSPVLGFDGFGFDFEFEETGFGGGGINELEEMYKPFVVHVEEPKNESPRSSHETETNSNSNSPCSSSFAVFDHVDDVEKPKEVIGLDVEDHPQAKSSCKKRKSKQKIVRVVHRGVGEDGVVLDKWNWRKYGQKAIKGSPYPRSYYRCSSSAGVCHARKYIEQSKDDPQTFIVTYIADHTHSPPTRRHAQAGRKITKFASSSARMKTNTNNNNNSTALCSDSMTWTISDRSIVGEEDEDHQVVLGGSTNMEFVDAEESSCLGFMKDSFSTNFDHDWSIWEFDPFFSTASVN